MNYYLNTGKMMDVSIHGMKYTLKEVYHIGKESKDTFTFYSEKDLNSIDKWKKFIHDVMDNNEDAYIVNEKSDLLSAYDMDKIFEDKLYYKYKKEDFK